jgi:hypothetical protein
MKLALISLTLCCIYVSISQQQFMPRRYPLPFYYNSYYDSPQLSRNNLMRQGPLFVVRNNYVQPYSRPSFNNEQIPLVTYYNSLIIYRKLITFSYQLIEFLGSESNDG